MSLWAVELFDTVISVHSMFTSVLFHMMFLFTYYVTGYSYLNKDALLKAFLINGKDFIHYWFLVVADQNRTTNICISFSVTLYVSFKIQTIVYSLSLWLFLYFVTVCICCWIPAKAGGYFFRLKVLNLQNSALESFRRIVNWIIEPTLQIAKPQHLHLLKILTRAHQMENAGSAEMQKLPSP